MRPLGLFSVDRSLLTNMLRRGQHTNVASTQLETMRHVTFTLELETKVHKDFTITDLTNY